MSAPLVLSLTSSSGLVLSRGAAARLGLVKEQQVQSGGFGDEGRVRTSVAHAPKVRIGALEFENCEVEILEKASALDIDGLIGGDVFRNFLLTLDFPGLKIKLDPLPKRPGEHAKEQLSLDTHEPEAEGKDEEEPEVHDRYIAPEMQNWVRIYRSGHDLLIPVRLAGSKDKLFIVDTGAASMMVSPEAGREITKVSRDDSRRITGISGEVQKVFEADQVPLQFGNITQTSRHMTSVDMTKFSHDTGVEISGFLGSPILARLTVHIDYRDNLMLFEYDPRRDGWK